MSEQNPYAPPEANLEREPPAAAAYELTGPRGVPAGHGWGWIAEGFGYFKKNPGMWILTLIVGLLLLVAMSLVPIVGQLALMLTTYVWVAGLMIGTHTQERGGQFEVAHLFAGFRANAGRLVVLSLVNSLIGMAIAAVVFVPLMIQTAGNLAQNEAALVESIATNPGVFLLPWLIAMLLYIPIMMAVWFAPALIALNDVALLEALKLSFFGCLKNILPFLLYGLIALVLYFLAILPLGLGLFVLGPTMIASVYASYRDVFLEPNTA